MRRSSAIFVRLFRWPAPILSLVLTCCVIARADSIEKIHDALSVNDPQNRFHLQLSGLVDLETYFIDQPTPALIFSERNFLFNPRLTLFLDAQIGSKIYVFAQTRVDRGFDPSDDGAQMRVWMNILSATVRRRPSMFRSGNSPRSSATGSRGTTPGKTRSSTRRCLTRISPAFGTAGRRRTRTTFWNGDTSANTITAITRTNICAFPSSGVRATPAASRSPAPSADSITPRK